MDTLDQTLPKAAFLIKEWENKKKMLVVTVREVWDLLLNTQFLLNLIIFAHSLAS